MTVRRGRWRHLDGCGTRIELEAVICRVNCRACGKVRTEQVPWARPNTRHSIPFENLVLWCARRMDKTAVAALLRIAWETVDVMIARAAGDPDARASLDGLRRIGVDEISYKRGHKYLTVVVDHDSGDVVWAAEGKDAATLTEFYELLGPDRCAQPGSGVDGSRARVPDRDPNGPHHRPGSAVTRSTCSNWLPKPSIVVRRETLQDHQGPAICAGRC